MLDIPVTNLKEAKHEDEQGNGTFYRKLLRKLPETMVAQDYRWIFEHKKDENVKTFKILLSKKLNSKWQHLK